MDSKDVKYAKYCIVPMCLSTSIKTPEKKFVSLPFGSSLKLKRKRQLWLEAMHRKELSEKTNAYVCEDHFNFKEDMVNYIKYELMGGKIFLKDYVVPRIFDCQITGKKRKLLNECLTTKKSPRTVLVDILKSKPLKVEDEQSNLQFKPETAIDIEEHNLILPEDIKMEATETTKEILQFRVTDQVLPLNFVEFPCTKSEFQVEEPVLSEDLVPSKHSVDDKWTQTFSILRTVSTQYKPYYRSKFVQTNICSPATQTHAVLQRTVSTQCRPYFRSKFVQTDVCSPAKFETLPSSLKILITESVPSTDAENNNNKSSDSPSNNSISKGSIALMENEIKKISVKRSLYFAIHKSKYYLGIPEESHFVVNLLQKHIQCDIKNIYLTLKKIKTNIPFELIADDFGISDSEAVKIFHKTVSHISTYLKTLIYWPSKKSIKRNLPVIFRTNYSNVQCILNCFEIKVEKSSDPIKQAATWSEYKKTNTSKYLISSTPDGLINFVSKGFGGSSTNATIVEQSTFLTVLPTNSSVMVDRDFKGIDTLLIPLNCILIRLPSLKNCEKASEEEVIEIEKIAALRSHIEGVIKRIREFKILKPHVCVKIKLLKYLDHLIIICCALANLQSDIVKNNVRALFLKNMD